MEGIPEIFHPAVREWFTAHFGKPTPPQAKGWPLIAQGKNTLVLAPTGSGKTLAAFLAGIDAVLRELVEHGPNAAKGVRILYISPLKALNYDIDRNLVEPLEGIARTGREMGLDLPEIRTAVRTGDTPSNERRRMLTKPPHILITTPESLHIILTSSAREVLRTVRYVIVDEIHSLCPNKRGVFLSVLLERLEDICDHTPARIGLSATQKPLSEVAAYLGGSDQTGQLRPVEIVDTGARRAMDVKVICSEEDLRRPSAGEVLPGITRLLLKLIDSHKSTIVFANTRRMVERLTSAINELAGEEVVQPHHGSVAAAARRATEENLKLGLLKGVIATGTLELGIDMGAVDLVCQVESPREVSRGLQRVGRAGHVYTGVSKGRIIPKTQVDLAEAAAVAAGMLESDVEPIAVPRNCLDVLAQQIVAMAALESVDARKMYDTLRRAYPFSGLSEEHFNLTLQMVSGRYPSKSFKELRPRVSLDRLTNRVSPLPGAQRLVIHNGGAIPDTGEYGVYLDGSRLKLGELDEEFVFESREGDIFSLGTNAWRIATIQADRVTVQHTSSRQARMPFWRGETVPRALQVGRRMGAILRETANNPGFVDSLPLDAAAAANLRQFVGRQVGATGQIGLPTDKRIVLEIFRDEIGERRMALLTTFGGRIHQALRIALCARIKSELGIEVEAIVGDNGILFRFPDADSAPPYRLLSEMTPDMAYDLILKELPNTALFGLRFRQNAARALLLPGAGPGKRTPLWLQRLKARDLLQIAKSFDGFPIVVETYRECLQDYLSLPALREILAGVQSGEIEVSVSERAIPSPFAASMLLDFQMIYQYEWDEPKGVTTERAAHNERRLVDQLIDGKLAAEVDERAIAELDSRMQRYADGSKCRTAEELYELLREVGDLSRQEAEERCVNPEFITSLLEEGQILLIDTPQGIISARLIANDYLDEYASGSMVPIIERHALHRAAVTSKEIAERYGYDVLEVEAELRKLVESGEMVEIPPAPGSSEPRWSPASRIESIYARTLAARKRDSVAVPMERFSGFLADWQHLSRAGKLSGRDGAARALRILEGVSLPSVVWENDVLARRVSGYRPEMLDEICASAQALWVGESGSDRAGRIAFYSREDFGILGPDPQRDIEPDETRDRVRKALTDGGALFVVDIALATGLDSRVVLRALWEMIWLGEVTHDYYKVIRGGKPPEVSISVPQAARTNVRDRRLYYRAKSRIAKTFTSPPEPSPGRWTLLDSLRGPGVRPEVRVDLAARILLERYGIATRDLANRPGELGVPWSDLYDAYLRMELSGEIERGYYVDGLSGAQFGLPEACDQLLGRKSAGALWGKTEPEAVLVNCCDPAFVFGVGGVLETNPVRVQRIPTNYAVLLAGKPALTLELAQGRLTPVAEVEDEQLNACIAALAGLFDNPWPMRQFRKAEIRFWGSDPILGSPAETALRSIGFEPESGGMVRR